MSIKFSHKITSYISYLLKWGSLTCLSRACNFLCCHCRHIHFTISVNFLWFLPPLFYISPEALYVRIPLSWNCFKMSFFMECSALWNDWKSKQTKYNGCYSMNVASAILFCHRIRNRLKYNLVYFLLCQRFLGFIGWFLLRKGRIFYWVRLDRSKSS